MVLATIFGQMQHNDEIERHKGSRVFETLRIAPRIVEDTSSSTLQAEREYNIALLFERTGHPGSAHFLYEIVRRRYPGTPFGEKAEHKLVNCGIMP